MPAQHRWTIRPLSLGRTSYELVLDGIRVALEVYDGGGLVPSHGIWRVGGRILRIDLAARC